MAGQGGTIGGTQVSGRKEWGGGRQADWAVVQKGRYEEKERWCGRTRGQRNYYGHQRGKEFVMGQKGLVCASLPGIHPIHPRVLPSFPMVHVSCSSEERHLPSACPFMECQVVRPPRWCAHYTAGRWCGPWWCTWGFPDSKFVFGKGNYPADGEDQGICGHHVCVSERGEDDSSDQEDLADCLGCPCVGQVHYCPAHILL
ncbi:uncharacterized protein LOC101983118 isoform X2 [Microtus ochrogaster]|uniref:Uncharacterized protein LOC101983118 isoform X2 n=1 Tax=Microtus ochrogaster TaxID=79684 RepID=A0ABM1UV56_MICOH|nr:uncharacterized protein LOC101983118 isoform X2 [Microtus ochrogaster]